MGLDKGHVYDSGPLLFKLPGERLAALVGQLEKQLRCKKEVDNSNNICAIGKIVIFPTQHHKAAIVAVSDRMWFIGCLLTFLF